MSEYWKSLPRKFCDTCKCWFADNKASIDFHEKGRRHLENVQKRINEIQKKGFKELKARRELENDMKKIEEAALEAFKKDLQNNPELADQYKVCIKPENSQKEAGNSEKGQTLKSKVVENVTASQDFNNKEITRSSKVENTVALSDQASTKSWYEGVSDDGHTYYWNSETSESQWDTPTEGYVSLQEQDTSADNTAANVEAVDRKACEINAESNDEDDIPFDGIGPQPKAEPYGQWITIEHKPEEFVDLQLPEKSENVQVNITLPKEESFKIKEKTVGKLNDTFSSVESTFKKRKIFSGAKRNVRKRFEEDN